MPIQNYPQPPEKPEFVLYDGSKVVLPKITYDFNDGCRVFIHPMFDAGLERPEPTFTVVMEDADTGHVLFADSGIKPGVMLVSRKKYYIRWKIDVICDETGAKIASVTQDLFGHDVLVSFPVGTLGDSIAWLYATWEFARFSGARTFSRLFAVVSPFVKELYDDSMFEDARLHLVTMDELKGRDIKPYATYNVGLFVGDRDCDMRPVEYQKVGLIDVARSILGMWPHDPFCMTHRNEFPKPKSAMSGKYWKEPYAAISVQASMAFKCWLNPNGWLEVVKHLEDKGLHAVCIDREKASSDGPVCVAIPYGAIDHTGDFALTERVDCIMNAEMFIGCSSGLAWLAWACRKPVIIIGGFTEPFNEPPDAVRVFNPHVCHGCWNDTRFDFDVKDRLWCPRHRHDGRWLECSTMISAKPVIDCIDRIHAIAQVTK